MFTEELVVLDGNSTLWHAARPLLDAALRLELQDERYSWHGWSKEQISRFLRSLPAQCSVIVGVWEMVPGTNGASELERLALGFVCEVVAGEVCSICTFEALMAAGLKSIEQLEPGIEDALEIMRVVRMQVAPVAWALFTDKATWDEWLFATGEDGAVIGKGELLASFVRQGRGVLLGGGSQSYMCPSHHLREG